MDEIKDFKVHERWSWKDNGCSSIIYECGMGMDYMISFRIIQRTFKDNTIKYVYSDFYNQTEQEELNLFEGYELFKRAEGKYYEKDKI